MDAELKQYLVEMEGRIVAYLDQRCGRLETALKDYVNERSESVETKLLTEFHKWASPAEARNRAISAALRAIDLEMLALGDRVTKLERNPPQ